MSKAIQKEKKSLGGSKIGRKPIIVPSEVNVQISTENIEIEGPKGKLYFPVRKEVLISIENQMIVLTPLDLYNKQHKAYHGLYGARLRNMIKGVSEGFVIRLELVGTGYRAKVVDKQLELTLGFSHPVVLPLPEGVLCKVEENDKIFIEGYDNVVLGQFAADIRAYRPPEPYKGKGVRFAGEVIKRKVGKSGKK